MTTKLISSGVHVEDKAVSSKTASKLKRLLSEADIRVLNPDEKESARSCDLVIVDHRLESWVERHGLVGLGDAFVDGWWKCSALDEFFDQALRAGLSVKFANHPTVIWDYWIQRIRNLQNRPHAKSNIERHYNLGNDVFEATLDKYMQYTCGFWDTATTLEEAQIAKLHLICRKLGLRPGMRLLDLGSGWGGLANFACLHYGVSVVGITLSIEQKKFAEKFCKELPVEFRLQDYRDTHGTFDRVTSIGMFEHVGPKNYTAAIEVVQRCLADDGLALLQFFATRDPFPNRTHSEVMWINKHIFPGLVVPSMGQIGKAIDNRLVLEDLHNFGAHYDQTLMAWAANFERNWRQQGLASKYDHRFYRTWLYYLYSCAGAFRSRQYQLWQLVLSKNGVPGGYTCPRHVRDMVSVDEH